MAGVADPTYVETARWVQTRNGFKVQESGGDVSENIFESISSPVC
jgi:hypothetical protein